MIKSNLKALAKRAAYALPSSYVLMLHHVTAEPALPKSGCLLDTGAFRQFMGRIERYVSVDELLQGAPSGSFAVTFDDGLEDLYTVAYPFLRQRGIPFTAFLVTDFLDQPGYITRAQLAELCRDPLFTVGAHGVTHRVLSELSPAEQETELARSKQLLEDMTGGPVRYFAYSHGQYNRDTLEQAKCYAAAFTTSERPFNALSGHNRLAIPRYNLDSNSLERQTRLFERLRLLRAR